MIVLNIEDLLLTVVYIVSWLVVTLSFTQFKLARNRNHHWLFSLGRYEDISIMGCLDCIN